MVKAVLFDLDGVITATSELHYIAWQKLATSLGIDIDREFNQSLKGVDRTSSLKAILAHGNIEVTEEQFINLMELKNANYLMSLNQISNQDLLPGIEQLLSDLKANKIKVAIASASKNAPYIVERLQIGQYIDYIANPEEIENSKPAPDIFLLAAEGVGVGYQECVGVEDAIAGVEAINRAGIKSISIGIKDSDADIKLDTTADLTIELILKIMEEL